MGLQPNLEKEQSSKSSNRKIEFQILTLFPEYFQGPLASSLLGKAVEKDLVSYNAVQIRDFATDRHHRVDDLPYGGGEGMLLKADVLFSAWKSAVSIAQAEATQTLTILLS